MSESAQKSFEIRTARQYLEELLRPAIADFVNDVHSSRKAVTCALFAWHLRDWVWAQHRTKVRDQLGVKRLGQFDEHLFKSCPELGMVQEIATGSKHFGSDKSSVTASGMSHGHPVGLLLVLTQSHLLVHTTTNAFRAEHLFRAVLQYWDSLFAELRL